MSSQHRGIGRRRLFLRVFLLTGLMALAAACGSAATGQPGEPSTDGDETLLAVADHSGLGPVEVAILEQPRFVITVDGTVYRPKAPAAGDSASRPAVPELEITTLDELELADLNDLIEESAGLFADTGATHPGAADGGFTEITVRIDGEPTTVAVASLSQAPAGDDPDPLRREAAELVDAAAAIVDGPDRQWAVGPAPGLRIHSIPTDGNDDADPGSVLDFPIDGAALLDETVVGCLDLRSTDLTTFTDVATATDATEATPWRIGGRIVQLAIRPLYAHEAPCALPTTTPTTTPTSTTSTTTSTTAKPSTSVTTQVPKPPDSTPDNSDADGSGCTPGDGALGNGRWFGYAPNPSASTMEFDLACWFSGQAAVRAAAEDGNESPPPNDYYVRNNSKTTRTLRPAPDTPVIWYPEFGSPTSEARTTYAEWAIADRAGSRPGVWLTIENGAIVQIAEQWTP